MRELISIGSEYEKCYIIWNERTMKSAIYFTRYGIDFGFTVTISNLGHRLLRTLTFEIKFLNASFS